MTILCQTPGHSLGGGGPFSCGGGGGGGGGTTPSRDGGRGLGARGGGESGLITVGASYTSSA
ncbi:hypothetical protein ABZS63_38000, partial [Streptomyces sp. NPDC005568]